jgi:hypothetical protein
MKRLALSIALAAATFSATALPAFAAQTAATTTSSQLLTTTLCYQPSGAVAGTLTAYGQGNKASSFVVTLSSGTSTVGGEYTLRHGTKSTPSVVVGTATLKPDYTFTVDTSSSPVALSNGRLKTDTFRVNGPGWGESYLDCRV